MARDNIGNKFEYDCMWFLQRQGYFVRKNIPVTTESSVEDATDIDIWGMKVIPPLTHLMAIIDCKYRKKPKVYERILWTKGIATYIKADRIFVASTKANWKMIDFGRRIGTHLITQKHIKNFLDALPKEEGPYGQANYELYKDFNSEKNKINKKDKEINKYLFEARNLYLLGSPVTNLNRSIEGLKKAVDLYKHLGGDPERQKLWLFIACENIIAFSFNLIKTAESVFTLPQDDRRSLIVKKLTYGDLPPNKIEEIVYLSKKHALESIRNRINSPEIKSLDDGIIVDTKFEPPEYAFTILGLLEKVVKSPMIYFDALKALELILFEYLVLGSEIKLESIRRATKSFDLESVTKVIKNYIAVICDCAGVERNIFWFNGTQAQNKKIKSDMSPNIQLKMDI